MDGEIMKIKTFNQALSLISKTMVPFYYVSGQIRFEEHIYHCPCPLQAIAELWDLDGNIPWSEICEDKKLQEHLISLADSNTYREKNPKDAYLFLLACGLEE